MKTRYLILLLVTLVSCDKIGKDEEFSLLKKNYNGYELKTDGYFLSTSKKAVGFNDIYVLYINGIALELGNSDVISEFEEKFRNGQYYQLIKNNPNVWGLFNIDSTSIKIEHLYPVGWIESPVYTSFGKILNDTTFVLTKKKHSYGSDEMALQDTFHFKQCLPKPDSTNRFIK
jgi:hypothetical protein